ncbi:unnamed protein product [Trichogramma brassicae]|uniref:Uncharacterized protein n=1 Tax=Trichogramma brassicae TaxID=86971 RepID=A0A6H5IC60_9HYME|nr:unnamed protein product [Trichogramma brassicae]
MLAIIYKDSRRRCSYRGTGRRRRDCQRRRCSCRSRRSNRLIRCAIDCSWRPIVCWNYGNDVKVHSFKHVFYPSAMTGRAEKKPNVRVSLFCASVSVPLCLCLCLCATTPPAVYHPNNVYTSFLAGELHIELSSRCRHRGESGFEISRKLNVSVKVDNDEQICNCAELLLCTRFLSFPFMSSGAKHDVVNNGPLSFTASTKCKRTGSSANETSESTQESVGCEVTYNFNVYRLCRHTDEYTSVCLYPISIPIYSFWLQSYVVLNCMQIDQNGKIMEKNYPKGAAETIGHLRKENSAAKKKDKENLHALSVAVQNRASIYEGSKSLAPKLTANLKRAPIRDKTKSIASTSSASLERASIGDNSKKATSTSTVRLNSALICEKSKSVASTSRANLKRASIPEESDSEASTSTVRLDSALVSKKSKGVASTSRANLKRASIPEEPDSEASTSTVNLKNDTDEYLSRIKAYEAAVFKSMQHLREAAKELQSVHESFSSCDPMVNELLF